MAPDTHNKQSKSNLDGKQRSEFVNNDISETVHEIGLLKLCKSNPGVPDV
jgi:hypothetical protein